MAASSLARVLRSVTRIGMSGLTASSSSTSPASRIRSLPLSVAV